MLNRSGRVYQWFVEPLNYPANEVFVAELPGTQMELIVDSDGAEHKVFRCSFKTIDKFRRATPTAPFSVDYRVFNKRDGGVIRRVPIFEPNLSSRFKTVKAQAVLSEDDPDDPF